jgi:Fe-S cluster assembly iron-binding protein IscA
MIGFTDWAIEILSKAEEAARRYNPDARIRVVRDGAGVRFDLTDEPEPSDAVVDREGFTLFVQHGLEGVVDVVEPHDRLILRSPADPERSVREQH